MTDICARLTSKVPSFLCCHLMPGGTDIFEVQGWQPQCPGQQPTANLPIWPTESPPRLIGQIARCSQTPVVTWQRPSEESHNVCKLPMLHVAGVPRRSRRSGTEKVMRSRKSKVWLSKLFPGNVLEFSGIGDKFSEQLLQCTQIKQTLGCNISTMLSFIES